MLKLVAIAFLLGGCSVVVEAEKGCCMPTQWESTIGFQNATVKDGKLDVTSAGMMTSYDFANKKVAYYADTFRRVQDYNKMMEYIIAGGVCYPSKLYVTLRNCMPDNATAIASLEMGGPKGVMIDMYDMEKVAPKTGQGLKGTMSINSKGCIPFSETLIAEDSYAFIAFMNVTSGIKDPSVFDVPSPPCPKEADNMNSLQEELAKHWPVLPSLL